MRQLKLKSGHVFYSNIVEDIKLITPPKLGATGEYWIFSVVHAQGVEFIDGTKDGIKIDYEKLQQFIAAESTKRALSLDDPDPPKEVIKKNPGDN